MPGTASGEVPPMQVPQEIRADISWMQSNEHNLVATPARAPRRRYLATSCSISSNSSSSTHKASGDRYGDDARVLVGDDASVYAKRAGNSFVNSDDICTELRAYCWAVTWSLGDTITPVLRT